MAIEFAADGTVSSRPLMTSAGVVSCCATVVFQP